VNIGDRAIVGAQSGIMSDIAANSYCLGSPAILERDEIRLLAARAKLPEMRRQIKSLERIVEALQENRSNPLQTNSDSPTDSQQDAA
jgi:UDP-3-O-[3-hydroxymyristoyl] glucosamine N-acyltransferase